MFNRRDSERSRQSAAVADPEPPVESSAAARAADLTKTYGAGDAAVHALDGVDVEFERGRFTA